MSSFIRIPAITVLLLFIIGGITTAAIRENHKSVSHKNLPVASTETGSIVVYYFHGFQRCAGCLRTEKMIREVLAETFASEMQSGTLVFRAVNVEELDNIDLVERFSVTARHPVVADERHGPNGPWKEIQHIPGNKETLRQLLKTILQPMLQNGENL